MNTRETVAYDEPPPPPLPIIDDAEPRRTVSLMPNLSGRMKVQPQRAGSFSTKKSGSFTALVDDDLAGPSAQPSPQRSSRNSLPPPPMAPNAIRVRLQEANALSFAVVGSSVVVTGIASQDCRDAMARHIGHALVSVNDQPCPRDPGNALEQFRKAQATGDYVDVELEPVHHATPADSTCISSRGESDPTLGRTTIDLGATLTGEL